MHWASSQPRSHGKSKGISALSLAQHERPKLRRLMRGQDFHDSLPDTRLFRRECFGTRGWRRSREQSSKNRHCEQSSVASCSGLESHNTLE